MGLYSTKVCTPVLKLKSYHAIYFEELATYIGLRGYGVDNAFETSYRMLHNIYGNQSYLYEYARYKNDEKQWT